MADLVYMDDDLTVAQPCSLPEFSQPFREVPVDYILTQDFEQLLANYAPLDFGTPHADYPDYLLALEGPKQDQGGEVVRWTRTYARKPDAFTEPGGTYAYNFIGYFGVFGIGTTQVTGRDRFSDYAQVQITREFFTVGIGLDYATWQEIPQIAETKYYSGTEDVRVDFLGDDDVLQVATTPDRTAYEAMIAADAADPESFSIVVEPSTVTRWMGNIFMRETRRIKAR